MSFVWPIALVVLSNIVYHVCAKSVPDAMNPFASLTVTYIVGAIAAAVLYFVTVKNGNLIREYSHINWAPIVLGVAIVGLEVGFIYAYKVGWPVSTASIVQSSFLGIALIFVGVFVYKEVISLTKIVGVVICLVGLMFINK